MAQGFAETLRAHAKEVLSLEGEQADEFLRLLRQLKETLTGRLQATPGAEFDAWRLRQVLSETEAGIRVLERKASLLYQGAALEAANLSIEHVVEDIAKLSGTFERNPIRVTIEAARVLADPAQLLLANHFDASVKRYGIDVLNGVRQEVFTGLRAGDDFGSVVRRVGVRIEGTGGSAERLARTEISQAYGSAQHSGLVQAKRQIPGLKKVWLHVGSFRCPVCAPLHGTERDLDGTWTIRQGKKTRKVAHAPAHPHCVCRVASMKPDWRAGMQRLGYLDKQPGDGERGAVAL